MALHLHRACLKSPRLLFPSNPNINNPPTTAGCAFLTAATVRALALKRSPKRLKYSAPRRFTKEGGLLYVEVYLSAEGAENWKLDPVIEILKEGAVGVIPTDTVYAIVCDLNNPSAIERLRRIKDIEASKDMQISFEQLNKSYRAPAAKTVYEVWNNVHKISPPENVGVRMPDDVICRAILERLDAPLISTSVKVPSQNEWMIDPVLISDTYNLSEHPQGLDFVVDGGMRLADPSTVVDMTGNYPKIVRQGKGPKLPWMESKDVGDGSREVDLIDTVT